MLYFSERLKLVEAYENWVVENCSTMMKQVAEPALVIAFLMGKGLLDEEKIHQYLKKE